MSSNSNIEWTDSTWNPTTGCTKVSQGCKNCYAETWANRRMGEWAKDPNRKFTDIMLHPEKLEIPLHWKKPRRIFVDSMSDLFHEDVPSKFIIKVFGIMALLSRHTFQVLTKRPERLLEIAVAFPGLTDWPNIWLGISCEDQKTADERIPILLETPAAVRWISAEPLLGEMLLPLISSARFGSPIDWVVVGGESGQKARPMQADWARSLRDQCRRAGVPFFFKQWGEWRDGKRLGKSRAGNLLDGRAWNEYPKQKEAHAD